jgi:hypothetical protein
MPEDRHPTSGQSSGTPASSTAAAVPPAGTGTAASSAPRGATVRGAAEQRILREGEAARLALAQRTALEVLAKPSVLDAKRLSRLGPDGLARFVAELRASALGLAQPAVSPPAAPAASRPPPKTSDRAAGTPAASVLPAVRSAGATRPALAQGPTAPAPRRAEFAGWWLSQRTGQTGFETQARRWGVLAGIVPILASLTWLALTRR